AGLRITRRAVATATLATIATIVVTFAGRGPLRAVGVHGPRPLNALLFLLGLIVVRVALEGWWAARRNRRGRLGDNELRWVILVLLVLFFLLSLGPTILYGRRPIGPGLYRYLYPYLLPLHAMRVHCRIGVIVVLGVGLLAGMGMRALQARLPAGPWRSVVPGL